MGLVVSHVKLVTQEQIKEVKALDWLENKGPPKCKDFHSPIARRWKMSIKVARPLIGLWKLLCIFEW